MPDKHGKTKPRTPPSLVPAVTHVTRTFHREDRVYGQLTSFFCRSELHSIPSDDFFAMSQRSFNKLRRSMDSEAWDVLLETIEPKTAPTFLRDYFGIYVACAVAHARVAYKDLLDVASANQRSLDAQPSTWAIACTRELIKASRLYAESWLQCVCDNRTYRPATVMNEVQLQKSWRPPALCLMSPFGPLPYKEKAAGKRLDEKAGSILQTFIGDKYEESLLYHVEQLAATEDFNALKTSNSIQMPPEGMSSVGSSKDSVSPRIRVGHDARKKKTQAMYRAWQSEHRKLKMKYPGMSGVWYAEKIAAGKAGGGKSAETIRKHLKK
jgi:hypothetical protein